MKKNSSTDSSAYLTHSLLPPAHWLARSLIFALILMLTTSGLLADKNAQALVNRKMLVGARSMPLIQSAKPSMPTVPSGPSLVSVIGRQIIVRKRNSDGTLALPASYVIRGVNWSPASRNTNTSPSDPNNANIRRPEFGIWAATDVPLIKNMNANTVRTYIDPGLNATGMDVLDQLYNNGIMVVMTVDDAINDLARVQQAVNFYKDHPAILMWMLGNEWNINRYFGVATSVQDAAQRTQMAASLIKSLDTNHPVSTSYGEIDIDADGLRLPDTQNYVNNVCTSVDVWGLNIYRGNTFGNLFDQWQAITPVSAKPMLMGEFGTDAFRSASLANPPPGTVDAAVQSQWSISEWDDIFNNLSANDPSRVATGGFVFEWNDEWWKVSPNGSQQTSGFTLMGGHPDDFANEEYFGVVDIDRQLRPIYSALTTVFHPAYQPPPEMSYRTVSRGALAQEFSFQFGVAWLFMDGAKLYRATGGGGGGRGFNIAAFNPCTGTLIQPVQHFDSFATRNSGAALCNIITFLDSLPDGTLIMIAVADEAGLNQFPPASCTHLSNSCIEPFFQKLEQLGSKQIRNYCYQNSWVMVSAKGEGQARQEGLGNAIEVSGQTTLTAPLLVNPASRLVGDRGAQDRVSVTASNGCSWAVTSNANWINVVSASGIGNGEVTYVIRDNLTGSSRIGMLTIGGQMHTVIQSGVPNSSCTYAIAPEFKNFSASGGTGSVGITAGSVCGWIARSNTSWIKITSANNGAGNGTVSFSVLANSTGAGRKGTITIAGRMFSVKQTAGL